MHISSLYALTAFAHLISGHPSPASGPRSLTPRRQTCHNIPHQLAGSNPHTPRGDANIPYGALVPPSQIWCDPNSATFVVVTFIHSLPAATISTVLSAALNDIRAHIGVLGDGNIPGGVFQFVREGLRIYTSNANNHQQTWGVLGAALGLVRAFMEEGPGAAVHLQIFDGMNEVAQGILGYAGEGS